MRTPGMMGGRLTRNENNGDRRQFAPKKINVGALLKRLWKYLGRNRLLLVLAAARWILLQFVAQSCWNRRMS